jgi:hypothetical protein
MKYQYAICTVKNAGTIITVKVQVYSRFITREKPLVPIQLNWIGPTASLVTSETSKISLPCQELNHDSSIIEPAA